MYGLLLLVVGLAILLLVIVIIQHKESLRLEELAYENHLRASETTLALINTIKKTKLHLAELELANGGKGTAPASAFPPDRQIALSARDHVDALKYDMHRLLERLNNIHERFPDAEFNVMYSALKKVPVSTLTQLEAMQAEGNYTAKRFDAATAQLLALGLQLQRLHKLAYDEARQRSDAYEQHSREQSIGLVLLTFAIGVSGAVKLLRYVRHILGEMADMQRDLQESEKNFRSLAGNIRGGVLVVQDGRPVFANEGLTEMLSYDSPLEIQRLDLNEIFAPDCLCEVQDLIDGCNTDSAARNYSESRVIDRYDRVVIVEVACSATTWQATPASLITIRNITELKIANDRLRETSTLLDNIVENVPNMIFMKRASDLSFVFFNRAGEELLGTERDALIGRNDFDFFPQEQAEFFTRKDREVLYRFGALDIPEEEIETSQGTRILHTRKIALYNEAGDPEFLLGISEDITEGIHSQRALTEFKRTLDHALDSVFMFDAESLLFIYANEGAVQQLGYSTHELMCMHPYDIKPEYDEDSFREMISPLLEDPLMTLRFETVHRHRDGRDIDVAISLQCIHNTGEGARFVAIVQDVSERKQAQRELEEYRDHLEELVEARTAELVAARDEAERANAAKSEFLSRMSHELRTPMNAILGFGQILQLDAEDFTEVQRNNVQEILDAGRHLLELINEVLDLARIESGRREIHLESLYMEDILQQCLPMIGPQAEARQLEVIDELSDRGHIISADHTAIKQVLLNLLSNAVKYNRDGGRILVQGRPLDHNWLRIQITDTGPGLTPEQMDRLFTPFERFESVRSVEGTGIGLVITRYLVELMGGRIGLESTPGEGSCFWVDIPLAREAQAGR